MEELEWKSWRLISKYLWRIVCGGDKREHCVYVSKRCGREVEVLYRNIPARYALELWNYGGLRSESVKIRTLRSRMFWDHYSKGVNVGHSFNFVKQLDKMERRCAFILVLILRS